MTRIRQMGLALGLAALLAVPVVVPVEAYDPASTASINVDATGLGLRGYDPVAYVAAGAPQLGEEAITASHAGVTYRFASEDNRQAFLADPDTYAPQYGGFCQFGVALGKKLDGDPTVWRVADGKLYVYAYPDALKGFLKDVPGNTAKAQTNWPKIKDVAPQDL